MENSIFGVGGIQLFEKKGVLSFRTNESKCFLLGLISFVTIFVIGGLMFYSNEPFVESRINICKDECSLLDVQIQKWYEFESDQVDVALFEVELEVIKDESYQLEETVEFSFTLDMESHNNDRCEDKSSFSYSSSDKMKPFQLQQCDSTCDKIFIAQRNYFSGRFIKIDLQALDETSLTSKSFRNIDLVITQRNIEYFKSEGYLNGILCLLTLLISIYFFKRVCQYNYNDLGVVHTQIAAILVLAIFFNEPFYIFYRSENYLFAEIFNCLCQASLFSLLVYFSLFVIDSLTIQDIMRESACKFYGLKLLLSILSWIFLLVGSAFIKYQESKNIMATYFGESSLDNMIFWSFGLVVLGYSLHLIMLAISSQANGQVKSGVKFLIFLTLTCIPFTLLSITYTKFTIFASKNGPNTSFPFNSLLSRSLTTLYTLFIGISFSPKIVSSQSLSEKNKHQEIVNQLYEHELPEMPTMNQDTEADDRGQYQLPADEEEEPKLNPNDPKQKKKNEIWEKIQKQAEEEDEDDDGDSDVEDEVDDDANGDGEDSEESQESEPEEEHDAEKEV